jgi:hypothetical protein
MRAEFLRPDEPDTVVGTARWDGHQAVVEAEDDDVRAALARVFRPTPVGVDDPSSRPLGSHGESLMVPGSLEWFRQAALTRAGEVGLKARVVPEATASAGWDPASAYRTFRQTVARMEVGAPDRQE